MILCDRQGNLVLQTASGNTASTTLSRRLIKYNAAGQELWNIALPVTYLRVIADADNDIVLAQRVFGGIDSMSLRKHAADDGTLLWENYLKGDISAQPTTYFLQTDAQKRVYLGLFRATPPQSDTNTLLCFNPEGQTQWSYSLSNLYRPAKMITDTSGAVYISGKKFLDGTQSGSGEGFLHKVANLGTAVVPIAPPPSAVPALALHWSGSGQQLGIDLSNCANLSAKTVQIVDMYGRVCLSQSLPDYASTASLDLPPLHAGIYVVVLWQAGQRIAQGRFFYAP
ncbi:MAG: PQQ-binding-like beta-propeller repeat protein [Chitinophagales bacterium]|nr:PQQ-binding-like beta-propeller repeat protein [Chitinophagales bacterium]